MINEGDDGILLYRYFDRAAQTVNENLLFLIGLIHLYPPGILRRMLRIRVRVQKSETQQDSLFSLKLSFLNSTFFPAIAPWEMEDFSAKNLF